MTAAEILDHLSARGIRLEPRDNKLRVYAENEPDAATYALIRAHKAALFAILEPERDSTPDDCPSRWQHVPQLPPKGQRAVTIDPQGNGVWYRVRLFGAWYLLRFEPGISETHVSVVCEEAKRRMFADLTEFYRWAWAEYYGAALSFKDAN